jgi:predicted glycosyltransferase
MRAPEEFTLLATVTLGGTAVEEVAIAAAAAIAAALRNATTILVGPFRPRA